MILNNLNDCINKYGERDLIIVGEDRNILSREETIDCNINCDYMKIKIRFVYTKNNDTVFVAYAEDNINNKYIRRFLK